MQIHSRRLTYCHSQDNVWWVKSQAWREGDLVIPKSFKTLAQDRIFEDQSPFGKNVDFLPYQFKEIIYYAMECYDTYGAYATGYSYKSDETVQALHLLFLKNYDILCALLNDVVKTYQHFVEI